MPVCACAGRGTAAGAAAARARWRASEAGRSLRSDDAAAAVGTPRPKGSAPRRPSHLKFNFTLMHAIVRKVQKNYLPNSKLS